MTKRDEWIRVRSESELRAGMCVEIRPCTWCGKRERSVLIRETTCSPETLLHDGSIVMSGTTAWVNSGWCDNNIMNLRGTIREGRLYRLADSQLTEDETTRELERVR